MVNDNQFSLVGKVALITGGAGFLGRHFAAALKGAGAKVVTADINGEADLLMDVTNKKSVAEALEKLAAEGRLDIVINNAAIDAKFEPGTDKNDKLFENYPEELLRKSVDVNLLGYVFVAQEAVRQMKKQGGGNIINVSSIYGMAGPDQSIYPEGTQKPADYSITKGGVVMLTKWLATTYGPVGIRANTLTLGGVLNGHDEEFQKKYGARVPFGRMVKLEEAGAPLVFLASDASEGMNGHNLIVDGGLTAW